MHLDYWLYDFIVLAVYGLILTIIWVFCIISKIKLDPRITMGILFCSAFFIVYLLLEGYFFFHQDEWGAFIHGSLDILTLPFTWCLFLFDKHIFETHPIYIWLIPGIIQYFLIGFIIKWFMIKRKLRQ